MDEYQHRDVSYHFVFQKNILHALIIPLKHAFLRNGFPARARLKTSRLLVEVHKNLSEVHSFVAKKNKGQEEEEEKRRYTDKILVTLILT